MVALGKISNPELMLPLVGFVYSQQLELPAQLVELFTVVEKPEAPVELVSVTEEDGYDPLPEV